LSKSSERGSTSIVKDGNPYSDENLESKSETNNVLGKDMSKNKNMQTFNLCNRVSSDFSNKEVQILQSRILPANSGRADEAMRQMAALQQQLALGMGRGANPWVQAQPQPEGLRFSPPSQRRTSSRSSNLDSYDYSHFLTTPADRPSEVNEDHEIIPDDLDVASTTSDSGSDFDRAPRTAYLRAKIRLIFRGNRNLDERYNALFLTVNDHSADMLVDTGCGMSVISRAFYNRLKFGIIGPTHTDTDVSIQNCHNTAQPCVGTTQVRIWFRSTNFYDATVLISEHLAHDFILGLDFLGSKHVRMLTPRHLVLNRKDAGLHMKEPLIVKVMRPLVATNNHCTIVEPYSTALLRISVTGTEVQDKESSFTVSDKSFIRGLKILPTAYNGNLKNGSFLLPVYNDGMSDVIIDNGCELAPISAIGNNALSPQVINVNRMMICETNEPFNVPINNILLDGVETIKTDKVFTPDEKKAQLTNLEKQGYYQPPITGYLHDKAAITDLGLEDTTPMSEKEFLAQFDLKHLSAKRQNQAKEMFLNNIEAFSMSKYDIGRTSMIEMNIPVTNEKPRMQKYIPIPLHAKQKVRDILDQLEKFDIIRKCNEPSPYCSNILVVKKRDKNDIRLLFDGRLLNYDTKRLPMSTVSKPEILAHLGGKKHMTSLDLKDAFFHIPLDKKSQPLTAFYSSVHGQRFCFTRAPQGLRNSPLYLKLLLDKVFYDMSDDVILFFDDLLIATDGTLDHHMKVVDMVLKKIILAGLKLGPKKLNLAKEHIEFLGMVFHKGTINIPNAKLEAFRKLPSPNTPKKAKSVICALSFYRHFCPRFAELSHEILALGNLNPKQFKWTADLEKKFRLLIKTVCDNASLYLPDPSKKIYVQSDASTHCAGGRVFQKDDKGNEMLIAAVSRTFTKTERAYSIFKKEILSLLYVLKTMDFFLRFSDDLTLLVDAKSIIYLRLAKESSGILLRFSLELSKYNCELFHVSGDDNIVSDVLSRHNSEIDTIMCEDETNKPLSEKDSIKFVNKLKLRDGFHLSVDEMDALLNGPSPTKVVAKATRKSMAKPGKRIIRNTPQTLVNKKLNLPKCSMRRPGVVLPKRKPKMPHNNLPGFPATQKSKSQTTNAQNEYFYQPKNNVCVNALTPTDQTDDESSDETFQPRFERTVTRSHTGSLPPPSQSDDYVYEPSCSTKKPTKQNARSINAPKSILKQSKSLDTGIAMSNDGEQQVLRPNNSLVGNPMDNPDSNAVIEPINPSQDEFTGNDDAPGDDFPTDDSDDEDHSTRYPDNTGNPPDDPDPPRDPSEDSDESDSDQSGDENRFHDDPLDFISYKDVGTLTQVVREGMLSIGQFKLAQQEDEYCAGIIDELEANKKSFKLIDGILFRITKDSLKPVLPIVLISLIIQLKHFSIFGAHMSPTRINRDIKKDFFIPQDELFIALREVKKSCYLCQLYDNNIEDQSFSKLPSVVRPRVSWSIDIIPNMPTSANDFSQLLLCVDDFSSFVVCIPLVDSSSKSIIEGLKTHIFAPFGIPQLIRSDEQSSFYSSNQFYNFMRDYKIKHQSTSVASPFSNGRAESQIGQIKKLARKFFFQENCIDNWDEFLPILTNSHNSSVGAYGFSSEELMFGTRIQKPVDLLIFDFHFESEENYINFVFEQAENLRKAYTVKKDARTKSTRTFKNLNRIQKSFEPGTLVLHRQLQVSTGKSSGYQPRFTGPFVVLSCNDRESYAIVEHLHTGRIIKGHYNNLHLLHFHPSTLTFKKGCTDDILLNFNKSTSQAIQANSKTKHPNALQN